MEIKVQIPFESILTEIKTLTASQKARLRQELADKPSKSKKNSSFTKLLLNGPVFTERQIQTIEENTKSISAWRTKN